MRLKLTNKNGFTMIELMVVVGIIGILAAIGLPQFGKFQAKARQSEAKAALGALYTAESSFFNEWSMYTVNLRAVGFGVSGSNLRYVTGFSQTSCSNYSSANGAPAESGLDATYTWSDGSNVNTAGPQQATFAFSGGTRTLAGTTSACDSTTSGSGQTFRAMSVGDPKQNVGTVATDGWTINQRKLMSNSTPGIQ